MSDTGFIIGGITYFLGVCLILALMLIAAFIVYPGPITVAVCLGLITGIYLAIREDRANHNKG